MNEHEYRELIIPDPTAMEALGEAVYQACDSIKDMIIYLSGTLGAGKTTFVRGFLRGMQYRGNVKSPTYTLVEPYEINAQKVYHFDFYRCLDSQELELLGIRDYFQNEAHCLVEWPEKGAPFLPVSDLTIQIALADEARVVTIKALSVRGKNALQRLIWS